MPITPNNTDAPAKLRDLSFILWGLLLVGFILPFSIVIVNGHRPPDADFAGFYSLGRILNAYSPADLYDYDLQKRLCEEVHPQKGEYGPLPYPPFVGLAFRPVAMLPYWAAYLFWVITLNVLYGVGLNFVIKRFLPKEERARSLLFALAYSYFPFIGYTAGNGQLAAVGFFAIALALREDDSQRLFRSGLALCLCLYKPTILLLIVPMLLFTRRFKALAGFASGTLLIVLVTTALEGFDVWRGFVRMIASFGRSSVGVKQASFLPLAKYVDLTSFSSALHGGRSPLAIGIFASFAAIALAILVSFWWKSTARTPTRAITYNALLWAATLTWTLLINVYVPIYDSILVVLSVLITAGTLRTGFSTAMRRWFTINWILILICSWFSVPLSRATSVQCMTLLFASLGILQIMVLKKLSDTRTSKAAGQLSNALPC